MKWLTLLYWLLGVADYPVNCDPLKEPKTCGPLDK